MNATVEKALQSKEEAGWQAWKDHNAKPVEALFTDDSMSIADGGVFKGKQQVLKVSLTRDVWSTASRCPTSPICGWIKTRSS